MGFGGMCGIAGVFDEIRSAWERSGQARQKSTIVVWGGCFSEFLFLGEN